MARRVYPGGVRLVVVAECAIERPFDLYQHAQQANRAIRYEPRFSAT